MIVNKEEFLSEGINLVDFYADWCGPCKMISPLLEKLDVNVVKVNIDDNSKLSSEYGIMSIPTIILFKNGKELDKLIGFHTLDELKKWIDKYK